jgi:hypothetical protein
MIRFPCKYKTNDKLVYLSIVNIFEYAQMKMEAAKAAVASSSVPLSLLLFESLMLA